MCVKPVELDVGYAEYYQTVETGIWPAEQKVVGKSMKSAITSISPVKGGID